MKLYFETFLPKLLKMSFKTSQDLNLIVFLSIPYVRKFACISFKSCESERCLKEKSALAD